MLSCSARFSSHKLKQQMQYDPGHYSQLPDLFDIEAILSTNRDNVTYSLHQWNYSRSNNVTVICADFTNFISGQIDPLFTLSLKFVSKFTNQNIIMLCHYHPGKIILIGILPAPNHVQYSDQSPTGQLQIMWEPLILLNNELNLQISVDHRITHYIIYITMEESVVASYNISGTFFTIEHDNVSCSLSFQVAAVNSAGMGEFSPPQDVDCELQLYDFVNKFAI